MSWQELSDWWLHEIGADPAYEEVVTPLLLDVLNPQGDCRYLDLGCGEGRVMRKIAECGAMVHGIDLNFELARRARTALVARLPGLPIADRTYEGVYSVLTLEHIEDVSAFFHEAGRVCKSGGILAIVINHPVWTAPRSTPISDSDGDVLWRPGAYFSEGMSTIRAGDSTVTFHHRSVSRLLNVAASAGWNLEYLIEQPHHYLEDQGGIPRLMACRWSLSRLQHD